MLANPGPLLFSTTTSLPILALLAAQGILSLTLKLQEGWDYFWPLAATTSVFGKKKKVSGKDTLKILLPIQILVSNTILQ